MLMIYILVTGNQPSAISSIISQLGREFALKDLGDMNFFLRIEVVRCATGIILSQKQYIQDLLQRA